jgi:magnesium chelatase family protein
MGIARIASRAQIGLTAPRVEVEVHLGSGLPVFAMVGLAATAVRESKDRVRAALQNSGFEFPAGRIIVNLSPADLPKEGCRYDLAIALGILVASGQVRHDENLLARSEFYGELGLAGELKPVRGVLLAAANAVRNRNGIVVPRENLREARIAAPASARSATHLLEACDLLADAGAGTQPDAEPNYPRQAEPPVRFDLRDVRGQAMPKRALTIAAAGGHSLLFMGPPGTGKSMLAQRLPGLLPPLSADHALEVAGIASVSGPGFEHRDLGRRPFRAPHHTASAQAIIGGGPLVRPGEVSLAHRGVLFLDELPEFNRRVLESLREPLETGVVTISRAALQADYPARFQLVAAMNPCPCGHLGDRAGKCRCSAPDIERYRGRISGPLLDRIDLRVEVQGVESGELLDAFDASAPSAGIEDSASVAARVALARELQLSRAGKLNAELEGDELNRLCALDLSCRKLLAQARASLSLSARSIHRVLRVARSIADLEPQATRDARITAAHIAEALQLRRPFT